MNQLMNTASQMFSFFRHPDLNCKPLLFRNSSWEGQAGYLPLKPVSGCGAESIQELRPGLEPVQATATRVTVDQLPSLVLSTVFL